MMNGNGMGQHHHQQSQHQQYQQHQQAQAAANMMPQNRLDPNAMQQLAAANGFGFTNMPQQQDPYSGYNDMSRMVRLV
jgi:hypothetical protein